MRSSAATSPGSQPRSWLSRWCARAWQLLYQIWVLLSGQGPGGWNAELIPAEDLLRSLKDGQRYLKAVDLFKQHCNRKGVVLTSPESVDVALVGYIRSGIGRATAEVVVAAMKKLHPPLGDKLPWTKAYLKILSVTPPPQHHEPMPWEVALLLAFIIGSVRTASLGSHPVAAMAFGPQAQ